MGIFLFNLIALDISTHRKVLSIDKKRFIIEVSQSALNQSNNTFKNIATNEKMLMMDMYFSTLLSEVYYNAI